MVKTQVRIPDHLYKAAKRLAAANEWSFAEVVRRGLEQMVLCHRDPDQPGTAAWQLPEALDLKLCTDLFSNPDWREDVNLGSGAARLIADRLREQTAAYEEGT